MEKSSRYFLVDDPFWQVEEVLDFNNESNARNTQIYYSDSQNQQNAELVQIQQNLGCENQNSIISISKLIEQEQLQDKVGCSYLKRSQMTLIDDSADTQGKIQAKFQSNQYNQEYSSDGDSYIIQECSDSQEKQFVESVLKSKKKTKSYTEKADNFDNSHSLDNSNSFKICIKAFQNQSIKNNPQLLIQKNEKKCKNDCKKGLIVKKQFTEDYLNQQNTKISEFKIEKDVIECKNEVYGHYKILSKQQKQFLVQLSKDFGASQIAKAYNISVNNICRWKKSCERKAGAGRRISNYQLQEKMIEFVKKARINGKILSRKNIQDQAKRYSDNDNFKASKGWFQRFVQRNKSLFEREQ